MEDETDFGPEMIGVDVWACVTIYVPAATQKEAESIVALKYAGTRTDVMTYDHMDSNDLIMDDNDFQSSACTYYGLAAKANLVDIEA